jgi:hypothetical protein
MARAAYDAARSTADAAEKAYKQQKAVMLDALQKSGVDSVTYRDYVVYRTKKIFGYLNKDEAADEPTGPAIAALKANGLASLVKESVNSNTLGAWVREQDRDTDDNPILPEPLRAHVLVGSNLDVGVRRK